MKKIKNILVVLSLFLLIFGYAKLNAQDVSQMVNYSGYCIFEQGLKKGTYSDNNGQTKVLQYMLASFGKSVYPKGIITGYFGDLTKDAIARFQARVGLTQTGYLDNQTWAVFCNLYHSGSYCPISIDSMKNGDEDSNGHDIKIYQTILAHDRAVYPRGITSGYYGPLTTDATKRFQAKYGLTVTGNFNSQTKQVVCQMFQSPAQIADIPVGSNPVTTTPSQPVTTINNNTSISGSDLVVTQMAYAPDKDIVVGTEVLFGAKEKNLGNSEAPVHSFQLFMNNQSIASGVLEKLGAMQERSVALYKWTCPEAGNYVFRTVLDPNNTVSEANEQNNIYAIPLTCGEGSGRYTCDVSTKTCKVDSNGEFDSLEDCQDPCSQGLSGKADLVLKDFDPKDFTTGEETDVKISIQNEGYARTDYSYMDIYISGTDLAETLFGANITIEPLSANAVKEYDTKWTCPKNGEYTLKFVLDTDNTIDESDENNNESIVEITCSGVDSDNPNPFEFACNPANGQCYIVATGEGEFGTAEECLSMCKQQKVVYGCNEQTWQCEVVTSQEEASRYTNGGETLEACMQICKPEATNPGGGGSGADPGFCFNGSTCVGVDSIAGAQAKYPDQEICCTPDKQSCLTTCASQGGQPGQGDQPPEQTGPNTGKQNNIMVNIVLEKPTTCVGGVIDVIAKVSNIGNVNLENARIAFNAQAFSSDGSKKTVGGYSDFFDLNIKDSTQVKVSMECGTPITAAMWIDGFVNGVLNKNLVNGRIDDGEIYQNVSQPIGLNCEELCVNKETPGPKEPETKPQDFSLEVLKYSDFSIEDKLNAINSCGAGNENCIKIKVVPKAGVDVDFYNKLVQIKFNKIFKPLYTGDLQLKGQDYFYLDYSKACDLATDKDNIEFAYLMDLYINNVKQNLSENEGILKCEYGKGQDSSVSDIDKTIAYYVDVMRFDDTKDGKNPVNINIQDNQKYLDYTSDNKELIGGEDYLKEFDKISLLVSNEKYIKLSENSYAFDLYSPYSIAQDNLYTYITKLTLDNVKKENIGGKTYYAFEFGGNDKDGVWLKRINQNLDICLNFASSNSNINLENGEPMGINGVDSCFKINFVNRGTNDWFVDNETSINSNLDVNSVMNTLDLSTLSEMNNILSSVNLNNLDLSSSIDLNSLNLSSTFDNNLDLSSSINFDNLNSLDLSSVFNNVDLNNFNTDSWGNDLNLNNFSMDSWGNDLNLNNFNTDSWGNDLNLNNFNTDSWGNDLNLNNFNMDSWNSNTDLSSDFQSWGSSDLNLNNLDFSGSFEGFGF